MELVKETNTVVLVAIYLIVTLPGGRCRRPWALSTQYSSALLWCQGPSLVPPESCGISSSMVVHAGGTVKGSDKLSENLFYRNGPLVTAHTFIEIGLYQKVCFPSQVLMSLSFGMSAVYFTTKDMVSLCSFFRPGILFPLILLAGMGVVGLFWSAGAKANSKCIFLQYSEYVLMQCV